MQNEISSQDLATLLGVTTRTVTELASKGIAIRLERGLYDMAASVKNYCENLREVASGRGGKQGVDSLTDERARLASEQADGHALKNAQLRGELLPRVEVESMWSRILGEVRSAMLAVSSRIQQRLSGLTRADIEIIDSEIREALRALGEGGDGSPA